MRFAANDGLRALRLGLAALGLGVCIAGGASAQMLGDGLLVFNNNNTGTFGGQFSGTAGAGVAACPGLTAATLFTVTYTHNVFGDPLLTGGVYPNNDFQPGASSPAYTSGAVHVISDGFFKQTCFKGAVGGNVSDRWWEGWTYFDSTGANRTDLHIGAMPNPRPIALYNNVNVYGHTYFSPDSNYLIRGQLRVKSQGVLSIAPGVVVFEERATVGTIVIERGGRIFAIGNACEPIIITTDDPPGTMTRGGCGGLVVNGRAKVNVVNSCAGDSSASEGGSIGYFGGTDDNDGSGTLRYVRIEYSGKEITPNNELNSFTFNAVGEGTHVDYCEAFRGADDSFEWFGGKTRATHLVGIDGTDDGLDSQLGSRCRIQFAIIRTSPEFAPSGTQNGDKGIESDNNEFDFEAATCSGFTNMQVANVTFIGDRRNGALFPGPSSGANFRRGTGYDLRNSIVYNYKTAAIKVDDDATWAHHCAAPPAVPAEFCGPAVGAVTPPIASGNVFVASSSPNPFRGDVTLSFTLPKGGPVMVEIYAADGRRVETLAQRSLDAGPHTIQWQTGKTTPSGVYFYRVVAGNTAVTGKLTRVD